jgi:hypothetical protein
LPGEAKRARTAVRYVNFDYTMPDRPEDLRGARTVTSEQEWREPAWRYEFGDSVDWGVGLGTACGRLFTVTWDAPGWHEGIWLREAPVMTGDANVAIWDVSHAGRWDDFIGPQISDVLLHYRPFGPDDGYWCSRITIKVLGHGVELLLGEGQADQTLSPSADNIAVVFPPAQLPKWEQYNDGI